ncbi:hypothetical protein ACOBQB_10910 [Streptomyces sp. G5(2025)]|uniref:hypothetical protein n=1 Tax=Streptomyces sp. G5(2025) TaxID=3406628 RepID=UPI003C23F3EE
MSRAYAAAGFGVETVGYYEGHGTGTAVGDATELEAFTGARRAADPTAPPAAISTVKGNIGHTKASAGVAGLIKAVLAVRHQIIPPATGHDRPHPVLAGDAPALRVPSSAELWPDGAPIRAGVSSMGFGGINAHIVVEHADGVRRTALGTTTQRLVRSRQDTELLLLDACDPTELRGRVARLAAFVPQLSFAELGDLAATLSGDLAGGPVRAAIVAGSPTRPNTASARCWRRSTPTPATSSTRSAASSSAPPGKHRASPTCSPGKARAAARTAAPCGAGSPPWRTCTAVFGCRRTVTRSRPRSRSRVSSPARSPACGCWRGSV